ncbi:MAG: hypothetical protein OK438_00785 [Thaumarchaeota archaeon]|nr:hypothetical protein [Nitrososphaerota archaeon]
MNPTRGPPADGSAGKPYSGAFIELESIQVHSDTLLLRISYHEVLDPLLTSGLFYAKFDFPIEQVPPSILSIPLLGFLAPLGWLTNAEIRFGDVDEEYLSSLPRVAQEFKKMYPKIPFSGRILANPVKNSSQWDHEKYCILYSGGVDSTTSLIRNFENHPSILTVRGAPDVPLQDDEYWRRVQERIQPFISGLGVESHVVETNALDMINLGAIKANFKFQLRTGWWEDLTFGLFLVSMSAPYTFLNQIGNVMISSSNTAKSQVPWGSSPMTDEKIRWGGIRVIHDSYDLERVEKIRQVVVPFAKSHGGTVPLRVCTGSRRVRLASNQLNCGQCSKCMVIELTLILSGADAGESGFDISPASLSALKHNLEVGLFSREYDESSWMFIKEHARFAPNEIVSRHPGLREFFNWFADWDERPTRKSRSCVDRMAPRGSRRRDIARAMFAKKENRTE